MNEEDGQKHLAFLQGEQTVDKNGYHVNMYYPGASEYSPTDVIIDAYHTRSSDCLKVRYDFDRCGWSVLQPKDEFEKEWVEVGFFKWWALEERKGDNK